MVRMSLTIRRTGQYVFDDPHTVKEYAGNLPYSKCREKQLAMLRLLGPICRGHPGRGIHPYVPGQWQVAVQWHRHRDRGSRSGPHVKSFHDRSDPKTEEA